MTELTLFGRSSSHFTRSARIFALELGVPHTFRPVFDIMSEDAATFADNPALKVPVLIDGAGSWFGTENMCRELARRSSAGVKVVLRGDSTDRLVGNIEELILHVMATEVTIITAKLAGDAREVPPKVRRSLENSVAYLNDHVEGVLAALPADRALSFLETTLFCTVEHLAFRQIMDVTGYVALTAFATRFGARASAQATEYKFDAA